MKSKSYKCQACGMVFLNSVELSVHEINVHIDKMYQCQSCNRILRNADEFNKRIKMVHNTSAQSVDSSIESGYTTTNNNSEKYNEQGEALESNIRIFVE